MLLDLNMTKTLYIEGFPQHKDQPPVKMIVPKYLFRYFRDDANLAPSLSKPYLWFSARNELNDPFELSARFKGGNSYDDVVLTLRRGGANRTAAEILAERILSSESSERTWLDGMLMPFVNLVNICCLSSTDTSTLMWSHYSGGHTGICLVLDAEKLTQFQLLQVTYTSSLEPYNLFEDLVHHPNSHVRMAARDQHIFALKHKHWSYEAEFRLMSKAHGRNFISADSIIGVIFGHRMANQRAEEIRQLLAFARNVDFTDAELNSSDGSVSTRWPPNEFSEIESIISDALFEDEELLDEQAKSRSDAA